MELPFLSQLVGWLRSGYPQGIPESDYLPLFALLSRRLSDGEVREIAEALVEQGVIPVDKADILVMITKITDEMPREEDVERISALLEEHGWPIAGIGRDDSA
ncbi:MAG TPA: DUF3349 domain-containing protein [Aldersonia sp.]